MGFKHLTLSSSNPAGCINHDGPILASFPVQTYSSGSEKQNLGSALQFLT